MKATLRFFAFAMVVALSPMVLAQPAHAESTLDKILKAKKIRIAIDIGNRRTMQLGKGHAARILGVVVIHHHVLDKGDLAAS